MALKPMLLAAALAGSALAHSAVPLVKAKDGSATTALGFMPNVKVQDPNKNVIEVTATTMPGNNKNNADGFGSLNQKAKITMAMLPDAISNAGSTKVPQVNPGDELQVQYRQLVVDGRYELAKGANFYVDETATGKFSTSKVGQTVTPPTAYKQALLQGQGQTVVGKDIPMVVAVPADLNCQGPDGTCAGRIANGRNEGNQFWGGGFILQQAATTTTTPAAAGAAADGTKANNKVGRAVGVRTIVKRNAPIMVRDGGVQRLAEALQKRVVPDEVPMDKLKRANNGDGPTMDDFYAFEAKWEAEHAGDAKTDKNKK